ncbi:MAG: ABC transporter substrate binding protein [Desulfococcaceae bacterium]|jgi:ABC-type uncharacterized transport system substrate-binding protein|nr:ABC transporter substrate binding protein [Desulfococcaceae bacterium]
MKISMKVLCMTLLLYCPGTFSVLAADSFPTAPRLNEGKKWRIGFYEGGDYTDYQMNLMATVQGLAEAGWLEKTEFPPQQGSQTKDLWKWLAANVKSKYLEFAADAHYSANWDKDIRAGMSEEIIQRLAEKKGIDLMIASGTWAGQDLSKALAEGRYRVPTLVVSTSDPIGAGIIKSTEDSGNKYLFARVDPNRFERQIRLFHEITGFKNLGVAYENTETGRSYAAMNDVEKAGKDIGFTITECHTQSDIPDKKIATDSVVHCFEELAKKKVDAIYVTTQRGVNQESIAELAQIANTHKIPTFSQSGSQEVRYGILMSVAKAGFRSLGAFQAEAIAKIFNGADPGQLKQVFESPKRIALNQKTAEIISFQLPMVFLEVLDEVYNEIETPKP